jgi:hypothetical protein
MDQAKPPSSYAIQKITPGIMGAYLLTVAQGEVFHSPRPCDHNDAVYARHSLNIEHDDKTPSWKTIDRRLDAVLLATAVGYYKTLPIAPTPEAKIIVLKQESSRQHAVMSAVNSGPQVTHYEANPDHVSGAVQYAEYGVRYDFHTFADLKPLADYVRDEIKASGMSVDDFTTKQILARTKQGELTQTQRSQQLQNGYRWLNPEALQSNIPLNSRQRYPLNALVLDYPKQGITGLASIMREFGADGRMR